MDEIVSVRTSPNEPPRPIFGIRDLVYVVFRRRALILAIWLPILLVGSLGLFQTTGSYVASSRVLLELAGGNNPNNIFSGGRVDYDLAISTYSHLAMSVPVAELAAASLRDSVDALVAIDPSFGRLRNHERMLEFLLDDLDVVRVAESNLLDIRYSSPYEPVALMADRAMRDAFLHYAVSAGKNSEALDYYDEQLNRLRAEVDSLLQMRAQVYDGTRFSSIDYDMRSGVSMVHNMESELFETEAQAEFFESHAGMLREATAENPDFVPLGAGSTNLINMYNRVEVLTERLNEARTVHPEGSRKVQEKLQMVDDVKTQMRQAVRDYIRSIEIDAAAWRGKAETIRKQIAGISTELDAGPGIYQQVSVIDSQIKAKTKFLEELYITSGELRVNLMADDRVSRLIKVTEPEILTVISGARKFAYFGLVGVFGLVLGVLAGVVVDRGDQRIHNADILHHRTSVPVLGAITDAKNG